MTASLTIDPGVARVALDRADKKSALDRPMRVALPRFFGQVQNDVSDHAAILAGADFSTGADSREMGGRGIPDELATSSTLATASLLLGKGRRNTWVSDPGALRSSESDPEKYW